MLAVANTAPPSCLVAIIIDHYYVHEYYIIKSINKLFKIMQLLHIIIVFEIIFDITAQH